MHGLSGSQRGLIAGIVLLLLVITCGVVGFHSIERWTLLDSFFMTVITISTVGYNEVHPLSTGGRLFASILILAGLGTVLFTTTMLGRVILEGEFRGTLRRRSMRHKIAKLRNHCIVCGFGRTGHVVAEELHEDGHPFVVIENNPEAVGQLEEAGYLHMIADSTEESVLDAAGIREARAVMALLSSDADNLYLTMMSKELNPSIKVVARALDDTAERRLKRGGADNVVATYRIAGMRVLQAAVRPTVGEFIELVTDRQTLSLVMEELTVHDGSRLIGKTLEQAAVPSNYGVIIVAIKKSTGEMLFNPKASVSLSEDDILIAIGQREGLRKMSIDCRQTVEA